MSRRRQEWWCANCLALCELDRHGRCDACSSDAVDVASREKPFANARIADERELERIFGL